MLMSARLATIRNKHMRAVSLRGSGHNYDLPRPRYLHQKKSPAEAGLVSLGIDSSEGTHEFAQRANTAISF